VARTAAAGTADTPGTPGTPGTAGTAGPATGPATGAGAGGPRGRPWRRAALAGGSCWAAAATAYALITLLARLPNGQQGPAAGGLLSQWAQWDTTHYLIIAEHGYHELPESPAFFPLYPLLIRLTDLVLPGGALVAALAVANLACAGALVVLYRLVEELDPRLAARTMFYLIAFPTGFFLCAGYNESLFLLLTFGAFLAMRRGAWWWAGGLAGLASATRMYGVLLGLAFLAEYLRQHGYRLGGWRLTGLGPQVRWDRHVFAVTLVPTGLLAYAAWCWIDLGDPLAFSHAQAEWGRRLSVPWLGLSQAVGYAVSHPLLDPYSIRNLLDVTSMVGFAVLLTLCLVGRWRLPVEQRYLLGFAVPNLALMLWLPVERITPLQSAPRYALELLPAFLLLARWGARASVDRLYLLTAVSLQVVLLLSFLHGEWVA
jgi:Gpi18-like mannosyltransferase